MKFPASMLALLIASATAAGCTDQSATPSAHDAPSPSIAANAAELKVANWGPKTTQAGTAFNLQPDGNSGIFAELTGDVPQTRFTATLGGKPLDGVVASGKVVTATVPAEYLATPGAYPVELQIPELDIRIAVGSFVVEGRDAEAPAEATVAPEAAATPSGDGATSPNP